MTFSNLKKFDVTSEMVHTHKMEDITLRDAEGNDHVPELVGKPATEVNKPYARLQLQKSNKRAKSMAARGATLETMDASREDDRSMYPRMVLTGWNHIYDDAGQPVEFSLKHCEEFLQALPNYVFDSVRQAFITPQNFVAGVDSEDLGN
jgi:hypothetical protein